METSPHASPGLADSVRRLGETLLGTARDRYQLVRVEVQEEKYCLIQTFIWISALIFSGMLALMFASLTLVYIYWNTARVAVLLGLTIFYAMSVAVIVLSFRRKRSHDPQPFKDAE